MQIFLPLQGTGISALRLPSSLVFRPDLFSVLFCLPSCLVFRPALSFVQSCLSSCLVSRPALFSVRIYIPSYIPVLSAVRIRAPFWIVFSRIWKYPPVCFLLCLHSSRFWYSTYRSLMNDIFSWRNAVSVYAEVPHLWLCLSGHTSDGFQDIESWTSCWKLFPAPVK